MSYSRLLLLPLLATASALSAFETDEEGMYAVFDTSLGEFTAKIAYDAVPLTVANFVGLAEGTIPSFDSSTGDILDQAPFYNGLTFHQFYSSNGSYIVVGGDPDPEDSELNDAGYNIPEEFHPNLSHNPDYTISMISGVCTSCPPGTDDLGQTTTGSQFFITGPALNGGPPAGYGLDGYFSVFGFIYDGTDVIDAMASVDLDENLQPVEPIVINSVTIVRVGDQANAFSVTNYELPYRVPTPELTAKTDEAGDVHFEFPASPGAQYPVETSANLVDWETQMVSSETTIAQLSAHGSGTTFARVKGGEQGPIDYAEPLDFKMNANIPQAIPGAVWNFDFKPDGTGTITFENEQSVEITLYQHYRLPNGGKIRISSEDILHEMMLTYRYSGENEGGLFVWIDDYFSGSGGNAERYPATGTFTVEPR